MEATALSLRPRFFGRLPVWRLFTRDDWTSEPTPPEHAVVRALGPNPLQILLIGGGPAMGYGVTSHEVSIAQLTGRGVDMDVAVARRATVSRARLLADHVDATWYDAVIISVGVQDVLEAAQAHWWAGEIHTLVSAFQLGQGVHPEVFVLTVPTLCDILDVSPIARGTIGRRTGRLNDQLRELALRRADIHLLPFEPATDLRAPRQRNSETYRSWAALIAPAIGRVVADRVQEHSKPMREDDRTVALHALGILDTPPDERFHHVVAAARDRFRSAAAALSFMDTDRQWFKSAVGLDLTEVPRGTTFCEWTIQGAAPFVVADARHDIRFKTMPIVTEANIRSYAGHPILGPEGTPIGAICVLCTRPHTFAPEDLLFLRQLAGLVESLLVPS
jgi:GAF domain-containing protein